MDRPGVAFVAVDYMRGEVMDQEHQYLLDERSGMQDKTPLVYPIEPCMTDCQFYRSSIGDKFCDHCKLNKEPPKDGECKWRG